MDRSAVMVGRGGIESAHCPCPCVSDCTWSHVTLGPILVEDGDDSLMLADHLACSPKLGSRLH